MGNTSDQTKRRKKATSGTEEHSKRRKLRLTRETLTDLQGGAAIRGGNATDVAEDLKPRVSSGAKCG